MVQPGLFALSRIADHRELFVFYAPAILAVLIPLPRRRVGPFRSNMLAPASPGAWGIALVCWLLIVNMGQSAIFQVTHYPEQCRRSHVQHRHIVAYRNARRRGGNCADQRTRVSPGNPLP
jgi:hypothetical protein